MTTISDITAIPLEHHMGDDKAYGMARGLTPVRNTTLILVDTDKGVQGLGEAWGPGIE